VTGPFSHSQACTKVHCRVVPLISLDISFAKQRASMLSRCQWLRVPAGSSPFKLPPLVLAAWHTGCDRNKASPGTGQVQNQPEEPQVLARPLPVASADLKLELEAASGCGRAGPCARACAPKRPRPRAWLQPKAGPGRLRGSLADGPRCITHSLRLPNRSLIYLLATPCPLLWEDSLGRLEDLGLPNDVMDGLDAPGRPACHSTSKHCLCRGHELKSRCAT
jgi:hypothetical protein